MYLTYFMVPSASLRNSGQISQSFFCPHSVLSWKFFCLSCPTFGKPWGVCTIEWCPLLWTLGSQANLTHVLGWPSCWSKRSILYPARSSWLCVRHCTCSEEYYKWVSFLHFSLEVKPNWENLDILLVKNNVHVTTGT